MIDHKIDSHLVADQRVNDELRYEVTVRRLKLKQRLVGCRLIESKDKLKAYVAIVDARKGISICIYCRVCSVEVEAWGADQIEILYQNWHFYS